MPGGVPPEPLSVEADEQPLLQKKRRRLMDGQTTSARRILLMTANVGSLFEEDQRLQESWLEVMSERILAEDYDMTILHMQETGGKQYVECSAQVPVLIKKLFARLEDSYPSCQAFLDLNYTSPSYTALGSIFFIHHSAMEGTEQYDFVRRQFDPPVKGINIRSDGLDNETHAIKRKFPKHFWPAIKWGRKGYLQTRWKMDNKIVDFINVHLFHDESNLALIHENPSLYSSNRKRALDFVLEQCVLEGDDKDIYRYIFGDLNFRLDSKSFLTRLTDRAEASVLDEPEQHGSQELTHHDHSFPSVDGLPHSDNLRRTVSAIEFRRDEQNGRHPNCVLRIEKKRFDYFNHMRLLSEWQTYLEDDKEVLNFPELHELPITFPPTYPWSEDPSDSGVLMKTRAPAWCDRVLMNARAFRALDERSSIYESIGKQVCMGDHKPVLLAFDLLS